MTDGTVVWTVGGLFGAFLIPSYLDFNDYQMPGFYNVNRNTGKQNIPDGMNYGLMQVLSNGVSFDKAQFVISRNNSMHYRGYSAYGTWNPWLLNEAIVAYSINSNGYIKYASGLIIQWGYTRGVSADSTETITFPISFTAHSRIVAIAATDNDTAAAPYIHVTEKILTNVTFKITNSNAIQIDWIAIGY